MWWSFGPIGKFFQDKNVSKREEQINFHYFGSIESQKKELEFSIFVVDLPETGIWEYE